MASPGGSASSPFEHSGEFAGLDGREQLLQGMAASQGRARSTHRAVHLAKVNFLAFHAIFLLLVCIKVDNPTMAWGAAFTVVFIGDAISGLLLMCAWFVSWPYIKMCLHERQTKVGVDQPSILTEVLPEIVLAMLGFVFVIVLVVAEAVLYHFLGADNNSPGPLEGMLFTISLLCGARAVAMRAQAALYGVLSLAGLVTACLMLVYPGHSVGEAALIPGNFAVVLFIAKLVHVFWRSARVLTKQEKVLRALEIACLLLALLAGIGALFALTGDDPRYTGWGCAGCLAFLGVAATRERIQASEAEHQTISFRLLRQHATNVGQSTTSFHPSGA
mmetsp:Transcript_19355/g.46592  ORF Transcript_19355/g.46592 Transcript_19355/m.46592 type:complete len:332 (-) Transcript_19355:18-1013(-)